MLLVQRVTLEGVNIFTLRCQSVLAHEEGCLSAKCDFTPDHHTSYAVAIYLLDTLRGVAFALSSVYPLSSGLRMEVKPRLVSAYYTVYSSSAQCTWAWHRCDV